MRDMPLALAWFLGTIFMLAGVLGAWIVRGSNQACLSERARRFHIKGKIVSVSDASSDDWGRRDCSVEYAVGDQRYRTTVELHPSFHLAETPVLLSVRKDMPSDAVLSEELVVRGFRWPIGLFLVGVFILAYGYAEEWHWIG
ncbi:MAG: hypothetical protein ABI905_17005 [Betaproteobacteria bacterium]